MNLAYDVCRCMGESDYFICAERDTCARYLAATRPTDGERVPFTSMLREGLSGKCTYKIEVE